MARALRRIGRRLRRALLRMGVAYRLRRSQRLLTSDRTDESDRVADALARDLKQLRR